MLICTQILKERSLSPPRHTQIFFPLPSREQMFQSTSGGNGGSGAGVGDAVFRNGFLHGAVSDGGQLTRTRPRRCSSRRRVSDQGGASNPRVSEQQETERSPRPCTDFDVAYFNSYAHLGIHEEMIKVRLFCVRTNILHLCMILNDYVG